MGIANRNEGYYHRDMELISVKLPPALRAKVAAEAQRRNVSQSTIVRESLERVSVLGVRSSNIARWLRGRIFTFDI